MDFLSHLRSCTSLSRLLLGSTLVMDVEIKGVVGVSPTKTGGDRTLPGAVIERYFYRGRLFSQLGRGVSSVRKGGSMELGSSEFSASPVSPSQISGSHSSHKCPCLSIRDWGWGGGGEKHLISPVSLQSIQHSTGFLAMSVCPATKRNERFLYSWYKSFWKTFPELLAVQNISGDVSH